MDLCQATSELDVFLAEGVQEVIDYKWRTFGRKFHLIGTFFHFFYFTVLNVYIYLVFVQNEAQVEEVHLEGLNAEVKESTTGYYSILLALGTTYPAVYDFS